MWKQYWCFCFISFLCLCFFLAILKLFTSLINLSYVLLYMVESMVFLFLSGHGERYHSATKFTVLCVKNTLNNHVYVVFTTYMCSWIKHNKLMPLSLATHLLDIHVDWFSFSILFMIYLLLAIHVKNSPSLPSYPGQISNLTVTWRGYFANYTSKSKICEICLCNVSCRVARLLYLNLIEGFKLLLLR